MKISGVLCAVILITACRTGAGSPPAGQFADIRSASGAALGRISVQQESDGAIRITGELAGLPPGDHGIHFHAVGRCDAPEFTTAGGHFNPGARQHGIENPAGPHAGDWPNITASAAGTVRIDLSTSRMTLDASPATGILDGDGTAIVIHAGPDDHRTDPAGNSGARIACGVITPR